MISRISNTVMGVWQRFSDREKRLAVITVIAVAVMLVVTGYQRAMNRLDDLDMRIMQLEDDLVSYTFQIAHRELVESRYNEIAAQHSSEWTEAEIHDRLRQEIYRLARRTPPPLDDNGIPVNLPNEHGNLVEIPSLGRGNITEGGRGYREYRINLRIPLCPLEDLIAFMERLQQSPQSLRIDGLDLYRAPDGRLVSASLDITRIVADGAQTAAATQRAVSSGVGRIRLTPADWQVSGGAAHEAVGTGAHGAVEIRASSERAEAVLVRSLPGGSVYEMIIDMAAAQGDVELGVGLATDADVFPGAEPVAADGNVYRLHIQFTLPGTPDTPVQVKCPLIRMQGADTVVHVSNLLLRQIAEV